MSTNPSRRSPAKPLVSPSTAWNKTQAAASLTAAWTVTPGSRLMVCGGKATGAAGSPCTTSGWAGRRSLWRAAVTGSSRLRKPAGRGVACAMARAARPPRAKLGKQVRRRIALLPGLVNIATVPRSEIPNARANSAHASTDPKAHGARHAMPRTIISEKLSRLLIVVF